MSEFPLISLRGYRDGAIASVLQGPQASSASFPSLPQSAGIVLQASDAAAVQKSKAQDQPNRPYMGIEISSADLDGSLATQIIDIYDNAAALLLSLCCSLTTLRTRSAILPLLMIMTSLLIGQAGGTSAVVKRFGEIGSDVANSVVIGTNGYYLVGATSTSAGKLDVCLLYVAFDGTENWRKTYGGAEDDVGMDAALASDGSLYIVGRTESNGAAGSDVWVLKVDSSGSIGWNQRYGGTGADCGNAIVIKSDGSIVIAGEIYSDAKKKDGLLLVLTSAHAEVLNKPFGGNEDDVFRAIVAASDGSYYAAGNTDSGGDKVKDAYIVKIDSLGNQAWAKVQGGTGEDSASSLVLLSDGSLVMGGTTSTDSKGGSGMWAFKLDTAQNLVWSYTYGTAGDDIGSAIRLADNFGFVFAGSISAADLGTQATILTLDLNGIQRAIKSYGESGAESFLNVKVTTDQGFVACGSSTSSDSAGDIYFASGPFMCGPGKYQDTTECKDCPAGKYNALNDGVGLAACLTCAENYYTSTVGQPSCEACAEGSFSNPVLPTSCLPCDLTAGFVIVPGPWKCLYKGMFDNEAAFTASTFATACFKDDIVVKPFPVACRTAYKSLCCNGAQQLTTVNCHVGLALQSSDDMFNKFCGPCPFWDQAKCPAPDVCWPLSQYPPGTTSGASGEGRPACLAAISDYCGPKLETNAQDPECADFSPECGGLTVSKAEYKDSWETLYITFNKPLMATLPSCNNIFDSAQGPVPKDASSSCSKPDGTTVQVSVVGLSGPMVRFQFVRGVLQDQCSASVDWTKPYDATAPTIPLETVAIAGTTKDKCLGLTVNATRTVRAILTRLEGLSL
jgi:hypothetical protein